LSAPTRSTLYPLPSHISTPPPTATQKPNKAAAKEAPVKAPAVATNGAKEVAAGSDEKRGLTKPDQAKYNAEQDQINKEIADLKAKMVSAFIAHGAVRLSNRTLSSPEFSYPKLPVEMTGEVKSRPKWIL
jgi:hypothetical protein